MIFDIVISVTPVMTPIVIFRSILDGPGALCCARWSPRRIISYHFSMSQRLEAQSYNCWFSLREAIILKTITIKPIISLFQEQPFYKAYRFSHVWGHLHVKYPFKFPNPRYL
jgi:hypothetical protein